MTRREIIDQITILQKQYQNTIFGHPKDRSKAYKPIDDLFEMLRSKSFTP